MFDGYGLQLGNRRNIDNTNRTLGSSSDLVLGAREMIWAGNAEVGFGSSHRLMMGGTNDGPGN